MGLVERRNQSRNIETDRVLFTPARPGALLSEARERGIHAADRQPAAEHLVAVVEHDGLARRDASMGFVPRHRRRRRIERRGERGTVRAALCEHGSRDLVA